MHYIDIYHKGSKYMLGKQISWLHLKKKEKKKKKQQPPP